MTTYTKRYAEIYDSLNRLVVTTGAATFEEAVADCLSVRDGYYFRPFEVKTAIVDGEELRTAPRALAGRCFVNVNLETSVATPSQKADLDRIADAVFNKLARTDKAFARDLRRQYDAAGKTAAPDSVRPVDDYRGESRLVLVSGDRVYDKAGKLLWPTAAPAPGPAMHP